MNVKIGDLRQRITFQEAEKTSDGYKGHTISWQNVVTVWAKVQPLSGREYFSAHQIKAEVTHRVKVRYRTDITEKMRIKLNGRHLNIKSILDLEEKHQMLEIMCKEGK